MENRAMLLSNFSSLAQQPMNENDVMEDAKEIIRAEAEQLRARIRATLEEADEFQAVANDAQQVAATVAERASLAAVGPLSAADIRRKALEFNCPNNEECELLNIL